MSDERPNEFLPWRGKLTSPDSLPEQGLEDKEPTWQRLAERLEKKPARRNIAWWIAAACLMLAFFPATLLLRTRPAHPNHIARHPSAQRHSIIPSQSHFPPAATPSASSTASTQSIPPAATPSASSTSSTQSVSPTGSTSVTTLSVHPVIMARSPSAKPHIHNPTNSNYGEIAPISPPAISATPPPPASVPPPSAALAPHTLRIVYFNEISKDPGPPPLLASRPPAFLRLSTASAAELTDDQNPGPIIKIRISSPNH